MPQFHFGQPPVAIPAGRATTIAFGGVPIAIPAGLPAQASFGTVTVAIAAGRATQAAFGAVPVAIPSGYAGSAAFGTPTFPVSISVTGFAATSAFGAVPVATQQALRRHSHTAACRSPFLLAMRPLQLLAACPSPSRAASMSRALARGQ
jgi:hypothetical protein